jgi:long-chain acyl-CoA synthetase
MKAPPVALCLDGQIGHEGNSLDASWFRNSATVARECAAAGGRHDSRDGALLLYTSGTTGRPKGVLLSHGNVLAGVDAIRVAFDIRASERTLCVMPLSHTNALMFSTLPFLMAGATTILRARFSASRHWDLCWKYRPTSFSASPTILRLLLEHPDGPGKNPELDYIKAASAPTPIELAETFEARFGKGLLLETYGLTETTAINLSNPLRGKRKFGSIGRPVPPQEVRVVNEQGEEMPPGVIGEIVIRGPTVMQGYYRDPEATATTIRDGWVHSGDLAYADEDGYVFIIGRHKEMIIRGGENVSPLEVERVLAQHPSIREVAVVGIPDAIWGEVIGACVVRQGDVEESELIGFAGLQLASFKVPQRVIFVDELPRNGIGKVVRRSLVGLFSGNQA